MDIDTCTSPSKIIIVTPRISFYKELLLQREPCKRAFSPAPGKHCHPGPGPAPFSFSDLSPIKPSGKKCLIYQK
jgi:hypothetical protein